MVHKYAELMFTDNVKKLQEQNGSRGSYAKLEKGEDYNNLLGSKEIRFIINSDSFYMATVGENDWPYVQHRGGPKGFVKIIDESTIGFSDFSGNKQYISIGNIKSNNRVSLFFMDYKNKRRLKIAGHIQIIDKTNIEILDKLEPGDNQTRVERGLIITILAFDWNCPQHITQRYTREDIQPLLDTLAYYEADDKNPEVNPEQF